MCAVRDSVTDNFLLKISATPPRAVALWLSRPAQNYVLCAVRDSNPWPTPRQGVALPAELTAQRFF